MGFEIYSKDSGNRFIYLLWLISTCWTCNLSAFQVFDVVLNGDLTIASDLDVFERVGRGVAHDEYIEFEVKSGKILFEGDETEITRGKMRVEFIKVCTRSINIKAI